MKKRLVFVLATVTVVLFGMCALSEAIDDVKQFPECRYCGMKRQSLAYSRMLLEHEDGTMVGTCSINCAAVDYVKDIENVPLSIRVGDYRTRKLIDAERAHWVMGGDKRGVMTERAKWAFKDEKDARTFIKKHGGRLATFDEVMKASYEDIYKDMRLTNRNRPTHRSCCKPQTSDAADKQ